MNKKIIIILLLLTIAVVVFITAGHSVFYDELKDINSINEDINVGEDDNATIQLDENFNINASIPVFMYHWIKDDTGDYAYPENMVKPEELRKQMNYLKENNYDVIFVSDINSLQHYTKPVILTFDDGWQDVYNIAFPYAKELNMKFCMYIIIDLIGTPGYCTLDELKEMRDSGLVEIGSHTLSHPYLNELSREQIENELVNSKAYIKENLEVDPTVICYPSGRQNATVLDVASQNYDYGLLMDGGVFNYNNKESNKYLIPRIYAMRSMTLDTFINYCNRAKVSIN